MMSEQPRDKQDKSGDGVRMSDADRQKQKRRSVAIALMLVGLAVLFYAVTVVRMGSAVVKRAI
jgi:hypothetical protein